MAWIRGGTSYGKLGWQNIFAAIPTIPVCPHLLGAHALFCHPAQLRPCMLWPGLQNIICRHCVDQQSDLLVFTEVHSDHREPLKSGRAKTYSRPLASKSGGTFALPALWLVRPLAWINTFAKKVLFSSDSCFNCHFIGLPVPGCPWNGSEEICFRAYASCRAVNSTFRLEEKNEKAFG